jgi:hypothetical protein
MTGADNLNPADSGFCKIRQSGGRDSRNATLPSPQRLQRQLSPRQGIPFLFGEQLQKVGFYHASELLVRRPKAADLADRLPILSGLSRALLGFGLCSNRTGNSDSDRRSGRQKAGHHAISPVLARLEPGG